jgi:murein DD-endopeptidase MepM/ murein hydrolase activator NlpD
MKKVRSKYSFCFFILFVFGFIASKGQDTFKDSSFYIDNSNNSFKIDSSFSIDVLRELLFQSKFNEIRILLNRSLPLLSRETKNSISELLIKEHPAFNRYWQTEEVWGNETHTVLPIDTVLQLTIDKEQSHFSWYGNIAWGFVWRWGRMHKGLDSDLKMGDTVRASFNGIVRYSSFNEGGYGNAVVIRHFSGIETLYGHFSSLIAESGQFVMAGEPIGLGGSTGRSTGPHLHFETRLFSSPFDPEKIFDKNSNMVLKDSVIRISKSDFYFSENTNYKNSIKETEETPRNSKNKHRKNKQRGKRIHTVKSGESLSSIARKYNTSVAKLKKINKLKNINKLDANQKLIIR